MFSVGPTFFSSPVPGGDPLFAFVRALYHMDGTNGGTSFPNEIAGKPDATRHGSIPPVTTTSEFEFPTASAQYYNSPSATGRVGGEECWMSIPNFDDDLNFGTGDFCIEGWFYPKYTGQMILFGKGDVNSTYLWMDAAGYLEWIDPSGNVSSSGQLLTNQWNYVAMDRNLGTVRLYVNGYLEGSGSSPGSVSWNPYISLGRYVASAYSNWYGFIDEIRVTAASRYTTSLITVPTEPFPNF